MPISHETSIDPKHESPVARPCTRQPSNAKHFYQNKLLYAVIKDLAPYCIFRHESEVLAQCRVRDGVVDTSLLAHDRMLSVLNIYDAAFIKLSYTPYGYSASADSMHSLLGFNGQSLDEITGCQLLGHGYRAFSSVLMRFKSPDDWSPFGEGGLNAYAYCLGNPINYNDPSGHYPLGGTFKRLRSLFGSRKNSKTTEPSALLSSRVQYNQENGRHFLGFHGTSKSAERAIMRKGVRSKSKGDSFFITNTFENASEYANKQKEGAVLAVYTGNFELAHASSTRGVVKQSNIPQLKIPRVVHSSLRFERVEVADVTSNFNRFMDEQQSIAFWINNFRKGV
ncbi:RHS repeat-associated core domain-containing protein [Pseudomonas capeferrum]|uniref:RHS repeat-associated core domain-containing protein n=1 Tax=Pseudomonas capeferrum TaxID=1495066 RepID=UPI0015E400C5|nr:RHS repeat-associated core domain-containing protein [Pseudomonas capeferrum]MBA1201642.1 RHS repeat-associated core domain-containing protein [Pseudomonas capeferrum]